ncbi:MAG: non-ribosomal peptide synthetase, partial [bacterium]|nr:non-ribosomal peptide synthetase [bacterium]
FNAKLPLATLFKNSTIKALSRILNEFVKEDYESVRPAEKKEYYTLSSAQKRLYVLQQMELESTAYNMPAAAPLEGPVNLEKLEDAFSKLIHRHDSLRTTFHMIDETPVQKIHPTIPFKPERLPGTGDAPVEETRRAFLKPFDLSRAPLLRVGIVERTGRDTPGNPAGEWFMLVDIHHIITDGASNELLTNELFALYAGESLEPLTLQYRDYAAWQNSRKQKELTKQQEEYWVNLFSGELPVLDLPTDYPRPAIQRFEGSSVSYTLNPAAVEQLMKTA